MATIPLDCSICPKKPKFSDVSHLLTHIASKGHLSHYYRLKIRAGADAEASRALTTYDHWYAAWGVEGLMSDRMNVKDKKKVKARGPATSRSTSVASSATSQRLASVRNRMVNTTRFNPAVRSSTDPSHPSFYPQTFDPSIKENIPPIKIEEPDSTFNSINQYPLRSGIPHTADYSHLPYPEFAGGAVRNFHSFNPFDANLDNPQADYKPHNFPSIEHPPRLTPVEPIVINSTSPIRLRSDNNDDMAKTGEDRTRLKGIQWPGMDIFDSATPIARRKRNQKKDPIVIDQLEAGSRDITAIEQVWSPEGNLRKEKPITGEATDSSSPSYTPLPKRTRTTRASTRASKRARKPATTALVDIEPPRQPYYGVPIGREEDWHDVKATDDLTYRDTPPPPPEGGRRKRKRAVEVWQDEDVNEDPTEDNTPHYATLQKPMPMDNLTRGANQGYNNNFLPRTSTAPAALEDTGYSYFSRGFTDEDPFGRFSTLNRSYHEPVAANYFTSNPEAYQLYPTARPPRFSLAVPPTDYNTTQFNYDQPVAPLQNMHLPPGYPGLAWQQARAKSSVEDTTLSRPVTPAEPQTPVPNVTPTAPMYSSTSQTHTRTFSGELHNALTSHLGLLGHSMGFGLVGADVFDEPDNAANTGGIRAELVTAAAGVDGGGGGEGDEAQDAPGEPTGSFDENRTITAPGTPVYITDEMRLPEAMV